jgi:hypothetical protein
MAWIPKYIATISKVRCVSNSTCKTIDMGTACEVPSLLTITLPDIMPHALSEHTDWNATCVAGNSKVHCVSTLSTNARLSNATSPELRHASNGSTLRQCAQHIQSQCVAPDRH